MAMETLETFGELRPAETALLAAAATGAMCRLGSSTPDAPNDAISVRPEFIRFLATGGGEGAPVGEKGLQIRGAWIDGKLDLQGLRIPAPLTFQECRFPAALVIASAAMRDLSLNGCRIDAKKGRAIHGDAVRIDGAFNMRHGFFANGEVRLAAAEVTRVFACMGAKISNPNGYALYAAEMRVAGNVYLRDGFRAEGKVTFFGARIGRDLQCWGGSFRCADGPALSVRSAVIGDALRLRAQERDDPGSNRARPTLIEGKLDLRGARAGALEDDADTWPGRGLVRLDGFVYGRLEGRSPVDARRRGRWLLSQTKAELTTSFRPQPFEQLMATLRQMGHGEEARRIGVLKERQRARAGKVPLYLRPIHWLFGVAVGYGYFTSRALLWSALIVVAGAALFDAAWRAGAMTPASDIVLVSDEWRACLRSAPEATTACWLETGPGRDYETFAAWLYAVDVFLPVVDLEQEAAWAPSPTRGAPLLEAAPASARPTLSAVIDAETPIGAIAWAWRILHEASGYVLSAFALAGAARLAQRDG